MRLRQTFAAIALMMAGAATAQNSIAVVKDAERVRYNPMIFGQFIEHFDNQVYGGIFDPGNALSDEDGFRKDVIEALREIKTPIVRWPGGCFVSTYHWLGGVGSERVPAYDKTWQVEDPNTFGTDEYIKWCRKVGCEPYICTNAGTGTPEEMSDWMEYCNLSVGKWGRMRMANGHAEPYNVKYWSVGNENWGTHELGARTVEEWGPMVRESAKLMRSVTKDAKLFAAAEARLFQYADGAADVLLGCLALHHAVDVRCGVVHMKQRVPVAVDADVVERPSCGLQQRQAPVGITRGTATCGAASTSTHGARTTSPRPTQWPTLVSRPASSMPVCAMPTSWISPASRPSSTRAVPSMSIRTG